MARGVWVSALVAAVAFQAAAQDAASGFTTTVSAGLTLTDGNSDTMRANASLVTEGEWERIGALRAGIEGNYGESTVDGVSDTTVEDARAFANAKRLFSPEMFAYADATWFHDQVAEVDYRVTLGPGLGFYLIKNEGTTLSFETGASYVWEDVAGERDDYAAFRAAERFEHRFNDRARVWQSAEYLPEFADFANYLLTAELGAEAALNSFLNLRIVLQDRYNSEPGAGLEKNDVTLIGGISATL